MSLQIFVEKFRNLNVNIAGGHVSPHKPCMLLSVIDLFDFQPRRDECIYYSPPLLERYLELFAIVGSGRDRPNPFLPFFFLRSEGFWELVSIPGHEETLSRMRSPGSASQLQRHVQHARLAPELHALLQDAEARRVLAEALVERWFSARDIALVHRLESTPLINGYERRLRGLEAPNQREVTLTRYERDPAFRRVVLEAYGYRCAATGRRLFLPDDSHILEAAHIEPHHLGANDDPRNGLALRPDFHRLMDLDIIAPGPDLRWSVTGKLSRSRGDNAEIWELDGQKLFLPEDASFWPDPEYLQARRTMLM